MCHWEEPVVNVALSGSENCMSGRYLQLFSLEEWLDIIQLKLGMRVVILQTICHCFCWRKAEVNNMHFAMVFFFKASSELLFFFFFLSFYFFARWISVANACPSYSFPSTHLSFISVVTVTSLSLGQYPWSAWEGYSVMNGAEPHPMESSKEKNCSGWEQLLHVQSLGCREMYSDMFPFAFAVQETHSCTVDWVMHLSSLLVSLKGTVFLSSHWEIKNCRDEFHHPRSRLGKMEVVSDGFKGAQDQSALSTTWLLVFFLILSYVISI